MTAVIFQMSQSGKLVFIIDSKIDSWAFVCLWYFTLGGGEWPECLEVSRCQGSGAATWLPKQAGCFLGLERALGVGSSFWLQNWLPHFLPGQL